MRSALLLPLIATIRALYVLEDESALHIMCVLTTKYE